MTTPEKQVQLNLEKKVQLMSSQCATLRKEIQAFDETLRTQQRNIKDLNTQYNEIWLAYAVQDGSSVIAPHSDRKQGVENMLNTNLQLSVKFSQ